MHTEMLPCLATERGPDQASAQPHREHLESPFNTQSSCLERLIGI